MTRCSRTYFSVLAVVVCLLAAAPAMAADLSFGDAVARARQCNVSGDTLDLVERAVETGRMSGPDGSRLLAPVLEAYTEQLPLGPFETKLAEGVAKHVAPQRIEHVLQRKLGAYRFAHGLLAENSADVDGEVLTVLGNGLSQGASRADVEGYVTEFAGQRSDRFLIGAHMVSLLGQAGFDYDLTRSMLQEAFAAGGPSPGWRYFIRVVMIARQRGLTDGNIASAAKEVLKANGSLPDVSARLGFTVRNMSGRKRAD